MPTAPRIRPAPSAWSLLATALVSVLAASTSRAGITITSITPGTEDAFISGLVVEDFEDVNLWPGFSVTFSVWRNAANTITAAGPVTYTGTLPQAWLCSADGFPANPWDGTHALVNGAGHDWASPFAASVEFQFSPPQPGVGIGLSNVQTDAGSSFTPHSLFVNGVDRINLEQLPGWTSQVFQRNRYIVIQGTDGELVSSFKIVADTHFDGMVFDKLALADPTQLPAATTSWGRLKQLYR